MVFERRIGGQTLVFGLDGTAWRQNIVLYDTGTRSHWCQFTGRAMEGALSGTVLIPAQFAVVTWKDWRDAHPDTTFAPAVPSDARFLGGRFLGLSQWVLGVKAAGEARAWPVGLLATDLVVNDWVGSQPLVVVCDPATGVACGYERRAADRLLVFRSAGAGRMTDDQTGGRWDALRGECLEGPLKGVQLALVPSQPSRRIAWLQFHSAATLSKAF
jgi:hypothetical protein